MLLMLAIVTASTILLWFGQAVGLAFGKENRHSFPRLRGELPRATPDLNRVLQSLTNW